jgi:hypothetical protein
MAGLLLPRFGRAHTPGTSIASFDVRPDGLVEASLVFASAEALGAAGGPAPSLEGDSLTDLEQRELRAFVLDGVEVTADGAPCAATFGGASVTEVDGLAIAATYACPPVEETSEVAVTLYYLSALRPGHRQVARIAAGSATSAAVLSADRRALSLRLPGAPRHAPSRAPWLLAAAAAVAAVALGIGVRRSRRANYTAAQK